MSFIDTAQLATIGANQIMPGHKAQGQNITDGKLLLTPATPAQHLPDMSLHFLPAPQAQPQRERYEILRQIQRTQPKSPLGRQADLLMREQKIFRRAGVGKKAMKSHTAKLSVFLQALKSHPQSKTLKQEPMRPASAPKAVGRFANRYSILKTPAGAPSATGKVVSLKQLPVRKTYGLLKFMAAAVMPHDMALKPVLALGTASRPANRMTYAFG
jgi:hypothetical protein